MKLCIIMLDASITVSVKLLSVCLFVCLFHLNISLKFYFSLHKLGQRTFWSFSPGSSVLVLNSDVTGDFGWASSIWNINWKSHGVKEGIAKTGPWCVVFASVLSQSNTISDDSLWQVTWRNGVIGKWTNYNAYDTRALFCRTRKQKCRLGLTCLPSLIHCPTQMLSAAAKTI